METLLQDLRYAHRALYRNPAFTAIAVTTIALGIGATTAIWSVARGVLLRPLPYPAPERLAMVWMDNTRLGLAAGLALDADGRRVSRALDDDRGHRGVQSARGDLHRRW